jgi:hypothetical protein
MIMPVTFRHSQAPLDQTEATALSWRDNPDEDAPAAA